MNSIPEPNPEPPVNWPQAAADIVDQVLRDKKPADAVLRDTFKSAGTFTRVDSREIARLVFDYFRWRTWLPERPRVEQVEEARKLSHAFAANPGKFSDAMLAGAIPDWTWDVMEATPAWLRSLQRQPRLWLRARLGQGAHLAATLGSCNIPYAGLPDCLEYTGQEDLFRTREFAAGAFEIQDVSSQAVGLLCAPRPGDSWWDCCAGEGGKSLHLSDLMQNRGLLLVSDRSERRLTLLKRRAARAKCFNYQAFAWHGGPPPRRQFHGVLVDAPCSGLGTWQRNPHARWTATPQDVKSMAQAQESLVTTAADALLPGGRLIYAVCTMSRAETTGVVAHLEKIRPGLEPCPLANPWLPAAAPVHGLWLTPDLTGGNGMFVVAWRRKA
jgi:16S rRNA (cytosine967-C5)-methyltransferase